VKSGRQAQRSLLSVLQSDSSQQQPGGSTGALPGLYGHTAEGVRQAHLQLQRQGAQLLQTLQGRLSQQQQQQQPAAAATASCAPASSGPKRVSGMVSAFAQHQCTDMLPQQQQQQQQHPVMVVSRARAKKGSAATAQAAATAPTDAEPTPQTQDP
jgi:hypothetical protein